MKNKLPKSIIAGAAAVAVAALLWSLDGTFLRPRLYTLSSPLVVFLEHLLGFIALSPFLYIYRKQIKKISKKQWLTVFWVALFGGALGTTFMTKALFATGFTDISVVILLQKFQPIFAITLAAVFLKEKFPKNFYIYAPIALISGYFVTFKDPFTLTAVGNAVPAAIVFSLLAAFAWGSSTTFGKYSIKNIHHGLLAALRFGLTVLIMIIPAAKYFNAIPSIGQPQWITLLIIVFSSGAAAMFLYYYGLKRIPASLATLCELSWPVSAIFIDYFANGNTLSLSQLIGTAVLLAAVTKITLMNKTYTLAGKVEEGMGQGQKIGFKTANLNVELAKNMPKGLYSCQVELEGKNYKGFLYYGHNSLNKKDCLEIHIEDFDGNIYEKEITVRTESYLRLPKKFKSLEKLAGQLKKDIKKGL